MKAILLAGGLGTRLRPITRTCPKPLLPVGNIPLLKRIILNLRAQGIKDFILLLHYQPEKFMQFLGDGRDCGADFQYVIMEHDLSTAGSVKFAREHIKQTALIYSADILADIPIRNMLAFHKRRRALVTLALHPITMPLPFGLVLRESDGRIRRFFEKPTWPQVFSDWINTGIYLIEPALLEYIPDDDPEGPFSGRPIFFEQEVFPPLAAAGEAIFGFPLQGYWRDVGTPEDLRMANMDCLHGADFPSVLSEEESELVTIGNRSVIGRGCSISPEAHIETCMIGSHCQIEAHARISNSVVFDNVRIGSGVQVQDAILMNGVEIETQADIRHNAVLAENAHIGAAAVVEANAVIRNNQKVAPGETITARRVLPTGYLRRFVDGGNLLGSVAGGLGTDFMRWVGKAFTLRQSKVQTTSGRNQFANCPVLLATQEGERFSAWARALAQGMVSAGGEVHLLEDVTLPVARWALQKGRHIGGIYLGMDTLSGLLRLALIHPSGEDFTTEESCSLERIDLTDAAVTGNLRLLDALRTREDYLRMVLNTIRGDVDPKAPTPFLPYKGSVLDRPVPVRIGVIGYAAEQIVSKFFAMLGWPVKIVAFPLDMSADFRRSRLFFYSSKGKSGRTMQKIFAQSVTPDVGIGLWMNGLGERLQLALPDRGMLPFGRSDVTIARLLIKENPNAHLVLGWLFPDLPVEIISGQASLSSIRRYDGCMLTTASLRPGENETRIFGFDGRGGIALSFPTALHIEATPAKDGSGKIVYPDALMGLAFLLVALSKTSRTELEAMIPNMELGYRLMPCPDENKAYLMRRLVESYDHKHCEFADGIRFEDKNNSSGGVSPDWVVVRPCAGKQALEIFWGDNARPPALSVSIRRRLALWRSGQNPVNLLKV